MTHDEHDAQSLVSLNVGESRKVLIACTWRQPLVPRGASCTAAAYSLGI
jgi:hypothetical protein